MTFTVPDFLDDFSVTDSDWRHSSQEAPAEPPKVAMFARCAFGLQTVDDKALLSLWGEPSIEKLAELIFDDVGMRQVCARPLM